MNIVGTDGIIDTTTIDITIEIITGIKLSAECRGRTHNTSVDCNEIVLERVGFIPRRCATQT
jgi:hypothetical protein